MKPTADPAQGSGRRKYWRRVTLSEFNKAVGGLRAIQVAVYFALHSHVSNGSARCYPGDQTIARDLGLVAPGERIPIEEWRDSPIRKRIQRALDAITTPGPKFRAGRVESPGADRREFEVVLIGRKPGKDPYAPRAKDWATDVDLLDCACKLANRMPLDMLRFTVLMKTKAGANGMVYPESPRSIAEKLAIDTSTKNRRRKARRRVKLAADYAAYFGVIWDVPPDGIDGDHSWELVSTHGICRDPEGAVEASREIMGKGRPIKMPRPKRGPKVSHRPAGHGNGVGAQSVPPGGPKVSHQGAQSVPHNISPRNRPPIGTGPRGPRPPCLSDSLRSKDTSSENRPIEWPVAEPDPYDDDNDIPY